MPRLSNKTLQRNMKRLPSVCTESMARLQSSLPNVSIKQELKEQIVVTNRIFRQTFPNINKFVVSNPHYSFLTPKCHELGQRICKRYGIQYNSDIEVLLLALYNDVTNEIINNHGEILNKTKTPTFTSVLSSVHFLQNRSIILKNIFDSTHTHNK